MCNSTIAIVGLSIVLIYIILHPDENELFRDLDLYNEDEAKKEKKERDEEASRFFDTLRRESGLK